MLSSSDITISYLKILNREPEVEEIANGRRNYFTNDELEYELQQSKEYKQLKNIFHCDFDFHTQSNIYSISNIVNDYENGALISNGFVGMITSSQYWKATKMYVKEGFNLYNAIDFTNVRFITPSNIGSTNHYQFLDMNKCFFKDSFTTYSNLQINVTKRCLQNFQSCFLQHFELTSDFDDVIHMYHCFDKVDDFNTYNICNNTSNYMISEMKTSNIVSTNLYYFGEKYSHHGYNIINDEIINTYSLYLQKNKTYNVFILNSSILTKTNLDNIKILLNTQNHSFNELINMHTLEWNKKWKTRIELISKENVSAVELKKNIKIDEILKHSLYNIYCDPYRYEDVYLLPILTLLKPELAKEVIILFIQTITNSKERALLYGRKGGYFNKDERHDGQTIYKVALLSIHIFNYFRVSKDVLWLQNVGFDVMIENADFLCSCVANKSIKNVYSLMKDKSDNNYFTNYLVYVALHFTNVTMYQLNNHMTSKYSNTMKNIQRNVFDDNTMINVIDTTITVKSEPINDIYHYTFYDSSDNLIGYQFGGDSGYRMYLQKNTVYTFKSDRSTLDYPFVITTVDHSNIGIPVEISYSFNSSNLKGYKMDDTSVISIFKKQFNTNYGENAFLSQSITNVIQPYDHYSFNDLDILEPLLVLNNYYNTGFYKEYTPNMFIDIVKDNHSFYSQYAEQNEYNMMLLSSIEANVAQKESHYTKKRAYINTFFNRINTIDYGFPWNHKYNDMLIFVMLTCVYGLSFEGEMNADRFMIKEYNIKSETNNVLPNPWMQLILSNVGYNNKTYIIDNSLYTDDPFDVFIDGIKYDVMFDEINYLVKIEQNLTDVFTNSNIEYKSKIFLQDIDDLTEYSLEEILANPNTLDETFVELEYTPLSDTLNQIGNYVSDIYELNNRVINIYLEYNGTSNVHRTYISRLMNTIGTTINPTIHATIRYAKPNKLILENIFFNSQDNYAYKPFTFINVNLSYNSFYITSNIDFNLKQHINISSNNELSAINLSYDSSQYMRSSDFDFGITEASNIVFTFHKESMFDLPNSSFPIIGEVSSFMQKHIYITNKEIYPPTVSIVLSPHDYVYDEYVIKEFEDNIDQVKYYPITTLMSSGNNNYEHIGHSDELNYPDGDNQLEHTLVQLDLAYEINSFLSTNNKHIIDIISSSYSSIYILRDNVTESIEYYGIGLNYMNMLMITDSYENEHHREINSLTRCAYLETFLRVHNIKIKQIQCTKFFTMIVTDKNKVYGIGYNKSFNMGTGENDNHTTFVECTHINQLVESPHNLSIRYITLNDTCTLIYLSNDMLYGVGQNGIFKYITEMESTSLYVPEEVYVVNEFIHDKYIIEQIEGGYLHFKFLLINKSTRNKEWWGLGRNIYNSLGVGNIIDGAVYIRKMTRLHQIEQFIYGKKYDIDYTGPCLINSNEYHFITNNGIPSYHIAILDKKSKNVYILGSILSSHVYTEWNLWILHDDIKHINPVFYVLNNHGLFIGGTSHDEYKLYKNNVYEHLSIEDDSNTLSTIHRNTTIYSFNNSDDVYLMNIIDPLETEYFFSLSHENNIEISMGIDKFVLQPTNTMMRYFKYANQILFEYMNSRYETQTHTYKSEIILNNNANIILKNNLIFGDLQKMYKYRFITSKAKRAIHFMDNKYLVIPTNNRLIKNAFTICFWFNKQQNEDTILGFWMMGNGKDFSNQQTKRTFIIDNGIPCIRSGYDDYVTREYNRVSISNNTWFHMVMRCDESGDVVDLFIDNVKQNVTESKGSFDSSYWQRAQFHIGKSQKHNDTFINGCLITDFVMYEECLTDTDIYNIYNSRYENILHKPYLFLGFDENYLPYGVKLVTDNDRVLGTYHSPSNRKYTSPYPNDRPFTSQFHKTIENPDASELNVKFLSNGFYAKFVLYNGTHFVHSSASYSLNNPSHFNNHAKQHIAPNLFDNTGYLQNSYGHQFKSASKNAALIYEMPEVFEANMMQFGQSDENKISNHGKIGNITIQYWDDVTNQFVNVVNQSSPGVVSPKDTVSTYVYFDNVSSKYWRIICNPHSTRNSVAFTQWYIYKINTFSINEIIYEDAYPITHNEISRPIGLLKNQFE